MVQWLGLAAFIAMGQGSISDLGIKIPKAEWCDQNIKKKKGGRKRRVLDSNPSSVALIVGMKSPGNPAKVGHK